nr:hypothetical protein [Paucibacter sp. M5-1]MCZ7884427.1 hypothetical protein [Paucibacter sp. M5-1]
MNPALVIPGHGALFDDVAAALSEARSRLAFFRQRPDRHARHAAKALIMFHLLEATNQAQQLLLDWLMVTPIHSKLWQGYFQSQSLQAWSIELIDELLKSGAIRRRDGQLQPT